MAYIRVADRPGYRGPKRAGRPRTVPGAGASDEAPDPAAETASNNKVGSKELRELIASLPGTEEVELHREGDNGRWAILATPSAAQFSMAWVTKECGGGNYMIIVRAPDGTGRILARRFFDVDPQIPRRAPYTAPQSHREESSDRGERMDGLPPMFAMMMQMQQESASRSMEMMQRMSEQTTSILTAMIGRPSDSPAAMISAVAALSPRADPMEMATKIAELSRKTGPADGSIMDRVEEFQLLKKLFSGGSGDGDDGTGGWGGLVREYLPTALEVIGGAVKNAQAHSAAAPAVVPTLAPGQPGGVSALPSGTPDPLAAFLSAPLAARIRELVPHLIRRGMAGGDPLIFAAVIVEDIPIGFYDAVHTALNEPDAIPAIVGTVPELAPVAPYALAFFEELRAMTGPEDEEPEEPAPSPAPKPGRKKAALTLETPA